MLRISNNTNKRTAQIDKKNLIFHIAIGVLTWISLVMIIQWETGFFKTESHEGDIALRPIYAPYDFTIEGDIDVQSTQEARKKSMDSVVPIYTFEDGVQDAVLNKLTSVIDAVKVLKEDVDSEGKQRLIQISQLASSYNLREDIIEGLLELKDLENFRKQAIQAATRFMQLGIISKSDYDRFRENKIDKVRLIHDIKGTETIKNTGEFLNPETLKKRVESRFSTIRNRKEQDLMRGFLNSILEVDVKYDKEKTELEKDKSAQEVLPIHKTIEVKKNEIILNKGERIMKEDLAKLKGIRQTELYTARVVNVVALAILVGLFMLTVISYIRFYEPVLLTRNKELGVLSVICIFLLVSAKLIVMSPWPSNLVPVAVASMLIAILINSRLAIITTAFLSILVGMVSGNILDITGVSMIGGTIGIFAMKGVRRRSQLITAGVCVGFANMSYLIGMGIIRSMDFNTYITESLFGFANGIVSAVVMTGILPIFENTFKITTDISLLELADLNHPLLKEMVIKAPGTYHHSLVVGNLAESACESIGANTLLARVGSYFHDIGKIEKASYFSENQTFGESAHDKLSPTMSSLIITNHIKNGVELAQKYKLPGNIIDIIKQHHGTGLVFYFFKRALEKVTDEEVGEESFRYEGPKPQTREAACVLLADSVEAASRALDDPTPARIKGLVRKIINNKFIDGQLDECELTLKDLEKIAGVFVHILTGIFHTRVEYPEDVKKT